MGLHLKTIKVKLLLVLLAFGLIPFVVISVLSVQALKSEIQKEIENKLILYADAKVEGLLAYFEGIEGLTLDFDSDGFILQHMQEILQTGDLGYDPQGNALLAKPLKTLEVYMVDGNASMFIHPQHTDDALTSQHFTGMQVDTVPVRQCLEYHQPLYSALYQNYRGDNVIGTSVCFPDRNWIILAEVSAVEAFTPLHLIYVKFAFAFSLFFLGILLAALVLSRRVTEPLQEVTEVIERVREGNLNARVTLATRDEIGTLAQAFNETVGKLQKSHRNLEKKVSQKTKKLHEEIVNIHHEKAKTEAVLTSIGEGIIVTDAKGRIVLVNPVGQKMLHWDPAEILGQELQKTLVLQDEAGNSIPSEKRPLTIALHDLKRVSGLYMCAPQKGALFPILLTVTPVALDHEVVGAIMVFHDRTKEKEVERMKTEFVSLVSHQLRTPLSGMKWFAEMLRVGDVGPLNDSQKEFVDNISELNERMIVLVNALLNIARMESGRIIIDPKPTRLGDLVAEVLKSLQSKIDEKKLTVVVSINDHLPPIKIDPKLIREVYSNLLSNAIKYTPEKGEITIFVSQKDEVILSQITDTGFGIPIKEQHKVFEKFFRGSNIATIDTDGNGLGLYLIKAIVEASGGQAWFTSEEGKGTAFFFSLPKKGSRAKQGEVSLITA